MLIISLLLALSASLTVQAQTPHRLRVASYNLRYDNPGDSLNAWKYRKETVAGLIKFHDFEIFGAQEVLHHQAEELSAALEGYSYVGVGRDDGKKAGELSPVFYREDKFKLLESGTFWLSEITDRPNTGWDAALPRICTWGEFEDRDTGFRFYLFNTHFDHIGIQARKESAALIMKKISEIAGNAPVILTGDFNVDQRDESYKLIHTSKRLTDSYERSPLKYGARGTFTGFNIHATGDRRIDHIFVTDHFKVIRHGILTDSYQISPLNAAEEVSGDSRKESPAKKSKTRLPSDHYPVMAELTYVK